MIPTTTSDKMTIKPTDVSTPWDGDDEAPDGNEQSSSDPALTTQACARFHVTRELATNHREQSPNIAQEGTIIGTPSFSRPTGRVILQALENGPKGATVNDGGINRRQYSPLPLLSVASRERGKSGAGLGAEDPSLENNTKNPRPTRAISDARAREANTTEATHKQCSSDLPADDAQEETSPRARGTIRPNGRSSLVVAPSSSSGGRSWGVLRVLSRFRRTGNSKGRFWKRSSRVADAGDGEMMSSCSRSISRSFQSGEDTPSSGRMVSCNDDEVPDGSGQSSSDPALTTQACAQFHVTRELATNHREQSPNIAQEGTIIGTPSFSRPTGRVILQALENGPKGATVNDGGINRRQYSPLPLLSVASRERGKSGAGLGAEDPSLENNTKNPRPTRAISDARARDANTTEATHKQYSSDLPADDAQEETSPRARGTIRPNGRSSLVVAPSSSSGGRSWGVLRVLSKFRRTGNSKGRFWKRSSRVADAGDGEMMSSCSRSISRSFQSGEDTPSSGRMVSCNDFPEWHDHARAKKHWRVLRAVLIALGELNCSGRESCWKIMFLANNPEHFDQLDSSS